MLHRALPCSCQAQAPSQLGQAGDGQWRAPSTLPWGRGEGEGLYDASAQGAGTEGLETMLVLGKAYLWYRVPVPAVLRIFSCERGLGDAPPVSFRLGTPRRHSTGHKELMPCVFWEAGLGGA